MILVELLNLTFERMFRRNGGSNVKFAPLVRKNLLILTWCAGITALGAFGLYPVSQARADLRLCNDTTSLIGVAVGYRENGGWITEGWWRIPGETCALVLDGDLNARFYYVYAEDADRGGQWRGDVFMCTADQQFHIEGVEDCFARGYQRTGFFEIDTTNKESWMVRLTETGQSGNSQ